jgi:selenocysteine lyase/cysteine desulfurase
MSRRAQLAHLDFTALAGHEGASLFFEQFLKTGSQDWSSVLHSRYPGLACWQGIGHLKQGLRTLAGSDPALPVLIVNRLCQLMRFAARLLFHPCRNVLVTDLGWPPYLEILESEARRSSRHVHVVPVRGIVSGGQANEEDVIEVVQRCFVTERCDGLFLPAVSHLGYRLPVARIVRTLEKVRELRFVVVDGAQDFCHVSEDLRNEYCDLYLAGGHKWLQGFHPIGLGFYGRQRSRGMIETLLAHLLMRGELDDPLLRFTTQIEIAALEGDTETVNLVPLFTCQGAAAEALDRLLSPAAVLPARQRNLNALASAAAGCGWVPRLPSVSFQTGILLLQGERKKVQDHSASVLRETFARNGVALTAYESGLVRLSIPADEWQPGEMDHLSAVLRAVA